MAIWRNTDGPTVHLRPSRLLVIGKDRCAFGRVDKPGWPEFRISSAALEDFTVEGVPAIKTRSRTYVLGGLPEVMTYGAKAQLREFLTAWNVPTDDWPAILSQIGPED